jgi:hypothetical protein
MANVQPKQITPAAPLDIEITPAMIEAGMDIAWRAPLTEPDENSIRRMVSDIFSAMLRARPIRPV